MKRFGVVSVLLAAALLTSACVGGRTYGDPGPKPCEPGECDNLETTVISIDWLGDGTPPDAATSYPHQEPDLPLQTNVWFVDLPDAEATRQDIIRRLSDAGFELVDGLRYTFRGTEWQVTVKFIFGQGSLDQVLVTVNIVDDDARAGEILAPISNALGTIP